MSYPKIGVTQRVPASAVAPTAVRCIRVAAMIGMLLVMTACAPYPSGNPDATGCVGAAGMPVPDCRFYK